MFDPGDLLFFHGLASSPEGNKAVWLRTHHGASAPAFDNHLAIEAWERGAPTRSPAVLAGPLRTARAAIEKGPRVLIGSSFGGMLASQMVLEGLWTGPTILLAPAQRTIMGDQPLPEGVPLLIIHGRHDTVIPVDDGRWLAKTARGVFWEVDDDHRLGSILEEDTLRLALSWAHARL